MAGRKIRIPLSYKMYRHIKKQSLEQDKFIRDVINPLIENMSLDKIQIPKDDAWPDSTRNLVTVALTEKAQECLLLIQQKYPLSTTRAAYVVVYTHYKDYIHSSGE
ncbi:MAG: hypothetical protein F4245_01750 [Cenarchaeum sp. SB0678_bin_8]|nr:hypothetical protein [Cenarchaeum sp. SB0666_bin_15]MYB47656.1 hypothetical protein [Cenarchaeum sp. SB0662_bin_33]MYD58328.1 hypothetical protein [Cenarchaeum sp. SB0678_bin_8]MYG33146.1 hypothetical protein [Cenarchaeum sp. SB0677_bin_16]MYI51860.1 hypothetical protein [Cenarchaeum sp. SB0673_bin_9]MYJ28375.1 hypothetical protein [Cenarchaeum sp. SB0672_bin_9]